MWLFLSTITIFGFFFESYCTFASVIFIGIVFLENNVIISWLWFLEWIFDVELRSQFCTSIMSFQGVYFLIPYSMFLEW